MNAATIKKLEDIRDNVVDAMNNLGIKCRKTYYDAVIYNIPAITFDIDTRRNEIPANVRSLLDSMDLTDVPGYTKGHYTSTSKKLKIVVVPKKK